MARRATDTPEMKVRMTKAEKTALVRASELARQNLTQWVMSVCLKEAERHGIGVVEPKKKGSR